MERKKETKDKSRCADRANSDIYEILLSSLPAQQSNNEKPLHGIKQQFHSNMKE
jgi:hypothetical protein